MPKSAVPLFVTRGSQSVTTAERSAFVSELVLTIFSCASSKIFVDFFFLEGGEISE